MKNLNKGIVITTLILTIQCIAVATYAQGPGFPSTPVDTPIDGGAVFVAVAAAGYGIKKLRSHRKV